MILLIPDEIKAHTSRVTRRLAQVVARCRLPAVDRIRHRRLESPSCIDWDPISSLSFLGGIIAGCWSGSQFSSASVVPLSLLLPVQLQLQCRQVWGLFHYLLDRVKTRFSFLEQGFESEIEFGAELELELQFEFELQTRGLMASA